jgi:hypothetical protein
MVGVTYNATYLNIAQAILSVFKHACLKSPLDNRDLVEVARAEVVAVERGVQGYVFALAVDL